MHDYLFKWCSPAGLPYRRDTYERQFVNGTKPLVDNPTIDEVRATLRELKPTSVLDIGCGWGRWLELLAPEFNITGCDVSQDMLMLVRPELEAFPLDIAATQLSVARSWDVGILRGVLHYLIESVQSFEQAAVNLDKLVRRKIVAWELPEVCEALEKLNISKFDLRPIERKSE